MSYFISASLFSSPVTPYTGLFVKHRLTALRQYLPEHTDFFVVSPTPYFPFKHHYFKHYALYAQKPIGITHYQGFDIAYPRYVQLPFTNSRFSGYLTYLAVKKYFSYHIKHYGLPKMLIAEYGFPDVLAVYVLSKRHHIPYVVTLRGSDISYFMHLKAIRPQMITALLNAKAIICVSKTMKQELYDTFQIPLDSITVIGNGVDNRIFKDTNSHIRETYKIHTPYIISSVGGLINRKNHRLAINAMHYLPNHSLLIVGTGEEEGYLNQLIQELNLQDRVKLLGGQPQTTIAHIYSASDLFLLCSLSEGRPNVVLEALACGTPVLTSAVQGVDELITASDYGKILDMKTITPQALADTMRIMTEQTAFNRFKIQSHGHSFSWEQSARLYGDILLSSSVGK
jgi:teichuronic acid biosynthesis glycosyltransferase TuaC